MSKWGFDKVNVVIEIDIVTNLGMKYGFKEYWDFDN